MADESAQDAESPAVETGRSSPSERSGGSHAGRRQSLRSQLLIAALCLLLGFGIVAQVRQTQGDELSGMRQEDLVRLLDEITQRNEALAQEGEELRDDRAALLSGSDASRSAAEYLQVQQILAGTIPVEGPGVLVIVTDTEDVRPQEMVHMLEELRNAGAEAIELSGVRIVASSHFTQTEDGLLVDGIRLGERHEWRVIGHADTLAGALEIPGGALAAFRAADAQVELTQRDLIQVTAIRMLQDPRFATPAPDAG